MAAKKKTAKSSSASSAKASAKKPASAPEAENTKEVLMDAAIPLFAKHGFDGTTVKEISDVAGVNISLISYHFGGKEGLYRACLLKFGTHRLSSAQRLLQPPQTLEECKLRLEMFIDDMLSWWQDEPDLCNIVQREADSDFAVARDVFESTFVKIFDTFVAFFRGGQQKKFLRSDLDPYIVASLVFGSLINFMEKDEHRMKHIGQTIKDPAFAKKFKNQVSILFLEGLKA